MHTEMTQAIQNQILSVLPDATVQVRDPNLDGQHFEAIVVSATFVGMPLVKQHQLVMNALKEAFQTSVHALALKTMTPAQWEKF